jgi:DNA-binding NtrC family response regulator
MQVLIVDDDKTFCQLLVEILESKGHDVDWTDQPVDGYKMSQCKRYDLFVFDVRMPLLLGTDLAAALKENSPDKKIILISAFADSELQETAENIGVPLLSKPFTTESFLKSIAKATGQSSNLTEQSGGSERFTVTSANKSRPPDVR